MKQVRFEGDHIWWQGKPQLLLGGEFQYFRIRRNLWEQGLIALKEAGINAISTYIPWVWHELAEGVFDFDGRTSAERDLRGFLYLCRQLEIPLIVKPGPYIYAEYQGFGIPHWVRR
ncbi:MAG: beta-galactosidase, partial [Cyanobacteria bacterium REEB65]|nr:beta-galactosidase [Cyanobacteria bacterium REEB65]